MSGRLLILLIAATALGPMAMQMFVPAMNVIQQDFGQGGFAIRWALSLSLVSLGAANIIFGPLSDRFGRRRTLLVGLSLFVLGSIFAAFSSSLSGLICSRILQAAGGGSGLVIARAIIRDHCEGAEAARYYALLIMAMITAPAVGPIIGGHLIDSLGWVSIFWISGVLGTVVLYLLMMRLPAGQGNFKPVSRLEWRHLLPLSLLSQQEFGRYALNCGFSTASFFVFASMAPDIMTGPLALSHGDYGYYFAVLAFSFMAGNLVSLYLGRRMEGRANVDQLQRAVVLGCATLSLGLTLLFFWQTYNLLITPVMLFALPSVVSFINGVSLPLSQSRAMASNPAQAGGSSGMIGLLQMALAAVFVQIGGWMAADGAFAMAMVMAVASTMAFLALFRKGTTEETVPSLQGSA